MNRRKITLLALIDAARPDLAVPILLRPSPASLLGDDIERVRSAPEFVGRLAQMRPDFPNHLLAELCALFASDAPRFRSSLSCSEDDARALLPGVLFEALHSLSTSFVPSWTVNLLESCPYADLAVVARRFMQSPAASVAMKLAQLDERRQAVGSFAHGSSGTLTPSIRTVSSQRSPCSTVSLHWMRCGRV